MHKALAQLNLLSKKLFLFSFLSPAEGRRRKKRMCLTHTLVACLVATETTNTMAEPALVLQELPS